MNAFDVAVLLIVGVAAAGGFMRGFVQEALSLASWALTIFAVFALHTDLTATLFEFTGGAVSAALLAFVLLLAIPLTAMRLIVRRLGENARNSVLGPIDRVLGFGFGAVKGVVVVVMAFSLIVLAYDSIWGASGRPLWISSARTYHFVDSSSEAMVQLIRQQREYRNSLINSSSADKTDQTE
jgi:membrane protein required for colicin V production